MHMPCLPRNEIRYLLADRLDALLSFHRSYEVCHAVIVRRLRQPALEHGKTCVY